MRVVSFLICCVFFLSPSVVAQELLKTSSSLYGEDVVARVRANVAGDAWAASVRDKVVEAAAFWRDKSDRELWDLVFGAELPRSWMVWSNGHSPVTGEPVPMYNWVADAQNHPWKMQDPTSGEWFPKNDFKAYYDSGLDAAGTFDPDRADKSLLFNTDHPDPNDPLHTFGVDDGNGYINEKGERWLFVATYLIYGQWKQLIVSGVRTLSAAYVLTGDPVYAHKAAVLIDRVADRYPEFDFGAQGILYEGPGASGYVSTWHDACEETREIVMSYDMIFEALKDDDELAAFLSERAAETGIENPKSSFSDIQRNIEGRILRDALASPRKIHSNYPRAEITKAIITAVLQEPDDAFWAIVDPMIQRATAVDGVTGEKGLAGYASFTLSALGSFLAEFSKSDSDFLPRMIERYPSLEKTFRFHIDTYCLGRYYPLIGDTGHYAGPMNRYVALAFLKPGRNLKSFGNWTVLNPSMYQFLWSLYEATGDEAYVQVLYAENGGTADGLPYDLYGSAPQAFRESVAAVIEDDGPELDLDSENKEEWHLAILRSGESVNARAAWIDYDSGGGHGHRDGLNIGLFAYGLDVMPDFGYPPVQFGGWGSDRAQWYTKTAAHNTVLVDDRNQPDGAGETTLWIDEYVLHGIRVSAPDLIDGDRFERTIVSIDIDEDHFYLVDVVRVRGGSVHTKFQQSHFGGITFTDVDPVPVDRFSGHGQMRNAQLDNDTAPGWSAEWLFEDLYGLVDDTPRGMRYWDFTEGASAGSVEGWIVGGMFGKTNEHWIPRLMVERRGENLESTFVAVIEPWKGDATIANVRRVDVMRDGAESATDVAVEVTFESGYTDTILLRDAVHMSADVSVDTHRTIDGGYELSFSRENADGAVEYDMVENGR